MRPNHLVLLTNRFPFGTAEQFLETEINYLCKRFQLVEIIPVYATKKDLLGRSRKIPEKAHVKSEIVQKIGYQRSTNLLRLRSLMKSRAALHAFSIEYLERVLCDPRKMITLVKFMSNSVAIYNVLLESYKNTLSGGLFYSYWLNPAAFSLVLLKRYAPMIKCVSRVHRGDLYEEGAPCRYLPFQRGMIEDLDKTFVISTDGRDYLLRKYPDVGDKLTVSKLGVRGGAKKAAISKDNKLRIVSCSSMTPVKRLELLVEALGLCRIPAVWTHIGSGPEEIRIKRAGSNLPNNVECDFRGRLDNEDVLKFYKLHPVDVFINVSKSEGIPVSIMESMSFGIPVFATAVGGTSEIVDQTNGVLFAPNVSAAEIADTLFKYHYLGEEEKKAKRRNALRTWQEKCNAERQYTTFVNLLCDMA
jgi:glycosyltransferase involved in cell wall biosynthesis